MKIVCKICPHHCSLNEGELGFCQARKNVDDRIICDSFGKITSIALDPIEKKPLRNFMPGTKILSVGSYGCNLRCPFCQNHTISMSSGSDVGIYHIMPRELVEQALELKDKGNIGIAYTYNEPFIGFEYMYATAELARRQQLKNVIVTNGYVCQEPLLEILPWIDAMNIDLKGFTEEFYKKISGDLETVKKSIQIAAKYCHLEVTTLIIEGENDSPEEVEAMAKWLSGVNEEIPLHLTKFYPRYKYEDRESTRTDTILDLALIARKHLKTVYT